MSPAPGYLAHQNRGPALLAYFIAVACITVLAICIRFYSRLLNHKLGASRSRLWWDDWIALAAVPFILGTLICGIIMIHFGLGQHIWNVPASNRVPLLKAFFAAQMIYPAAMGLCRESALLFCSRIFRKHVSPRWFSYGLYAAHVCNVAWFIAVTVDKVFICTPVAKNWDSKLPGKCGAVSPYWLGSAISSVVLDLVILLLPMPIIWALNFSKGRKLALSAVFACGYCVIIISVGRVIVIMRQQTAMAADLTYSAPPVMYWLFGESPMALLSICLPATSYLGARWMTSLIPITSKIRSLLSSRSSTPAVSDASYADEKKRGSSVEKLFPSSSDHTLFSASSGQGYSARSERSQSVHGVDDQEQNIHVKTTFSVAREI